MRERKRERERETSRGLYPVGGNEPCSRIEDPWRAELDEDMMSFFSFSFFLFPPGKILSCILNDMTERPLRQTRQSSISDDNFTTTMASTSRRYMVWIWILVSHVFTSLTKKKDFGWPGLVCFPPFFSWVSQDQPETEDTPKTNSRTGFLCWIGQ